MDGSLEETFKRLADEWHRDTDMMSSPTRKRNHQAYRAIVAMGLVAIPFILRDLNEHGGDWYGALVEITGKSPVPPDGDGYVRQMNECWLRWGKENGYWDD